MILLTRIIHIHRSSVRNQIQPLRKRASTPRGVPLHARLNAAYLTAMPLDAVHVQHQSPMATETALRLHTRAAACYGNVYRVAVARRSSKHLKT